MYLSSSLILSLISALWWGIPLSEGPWHLRGVASFCLLWHLSCPHTSSSWGAEIPGGSYLLVLVRRWGLVIFRKLKGPTQIHV